METNWRNYTSDESDRRILEILDAPSGLYEELDYIPNRDRLTYANGFYVWCTAVFVDIRDSSALPRLHRTPVLGKIYRAYISECVALLNTYRHCKEVFITGDCVSGIFDTPYRQNINEAFDACYSLNSLIKHLNWRLEQKGYTPIKCGIGIAQGRALMLKSGLSGSGVNDLVWMGDVVNHASNLCHQGNKNGKLPIQVSTSTYDGLSQHNRNLLYPVQDNPILAALGGYVDHYQGDIVNRGMNDWLFDRQRTFDLGNLSSILAGTRDTIPPFLLSDVLSGLHGTAKPDFSTLLSGPSSFTSPSPQYYGLNRLFETNKPGR
jgi:class 3 adenylate cyclase